jgi:hypothetical protein
MMCHLDHNPSNRGQSTNSAARAGPARLINLADEGIAAASRAVAAAALLDPSAMADHSGSIMLRLADTQPSPLRSFARKVRAKRATPVNFASTPVLSRACPRSAFCDSSKLYASSEEVRTATLIFLAEHRPVTACAFRQRLRPTKSLCIHR